MARDTIKEIALEAYFRLEKKMVIEALIPLRKLVLDNVTPINFFRIPDRFYLCDFDYDIRIDNSSIEEAYSKFTRNGWAFGYEDNEGFSHVEFYLKANLSGRTLKIGFSNALNDKGKKFNVDTFEYKDVTGEGIDIYCNCNDELSILFDCTAHTEIIMHCKTIKVEHLIAETSQMLAELVNPDGTLRNITGCE